MPLEIERKFLVSNTSYVQESHAKTYIKQGFLNRDKQRTVRIRITDDKGYLTIKGQSSDKGTTRFEWEKELSLAEAKDLFQLAEEGIIEKYRYLVRSGKHLIEVDEFLGKNQGLIVAEIELNSENEPFERPDWLGAEVTGDPRYYNSVLSQSPFQNWE